MIYHLVLFKMKPSATPAKIRTAERAWRALKKDIRGLHSVVGGTNISIENLDKGFNRAYVVTFSDKKSRNTYVTHPAHNAFVNKHLLPLIEDVCVADVEF